MEMKGRFKVAELNNHVKLNYSSTSSNNLHKYSTCTSITERKNAFWKWKQTTGCNSTTTKECQTVKPGTKKIILLPEIFHQSRTSSAHCSQSPRIYNKWTEWERTWLVSGLHLLRLHAQGFLNDDSPSHSANSSGPHCLSIWHHCIQWRGHLSSWGSASLQETEESRQCRNCLQSGSLWAAVCHPWACF